MSNAEAATARDDWSTLDALQHAASEAERAWSGSSIGYHATVYYANLEVPPAGARFSQEWGLMGIGETRGNWREYGHKEVIDEILRRAGNADVEPLERSAAEMQKRFEKTRGRVRSVLSLELARQADGHLDSLLTQINELKPLSLSAAITFQIRRGQFIVRDMAALGQGFRSAPHQDVLGRVIAIRARVSEAEDLASLVVQAAEHLERRAVGEHASGDSPGTRVFIGHGRSPQWRELKDFVRDRLKLEWDEYDRTPSAGLARKERLQEMLDSASFALLVLTAEDELADGHLVARQNVVHEAGLFQGRLGWRRAIILLEEGCEEFSNIEGLGQIRFPRGRIPASFEDVRRVLEREGFIDS